MYNYLITYETLKAFYNEDNSKKDKRKTKKVKKKSK